MGEGIPLEDAESAAAAAAAGGAAGTNHSDEDAPPHTPNTPHTAEQANESRANLRRLTSVAGLPLLQPKVLTKVATMKEQRSAEVESTPFKKINLPVLGEVGWDDVEREAWKWIKNPVNLALVLWAIGVCISGGLYGLIILGVLDLAIPNAETRADWGEVCNQIMNAFFTLMCIVLQPERLRLAIRLYVWAPQDILVMRATLCKDGLRKPDEWKHMFVVVFLLNMNCVCQYVLAGLNWGYTRQTRPIYVVLPFLVGAVGSGFLAGLYAGLSPLGQDVDGGPLPEDDIEGAMSSKAAAFEKKRLYFENERIEAVEPQWQGNVVCGYCSNPQVACMSTCCCICILGVNQEKLGFGNKWTHIFSFSLFLFAPLLIFGLAAIDIKYDLTRRVILGVGVLFSVLGILYGGYWRMRMRRAYKLPKHRWFYGHGMLTDFVTWLLCSCCALSQEVRTCEYYEVFDGKIYERPEEGVGAGKAKEMGVIAEEEEAGEGGEGKGTEMEAPDVPKMV
eukprot:TRINITY_DN258_c0_g2_i1.p1 TRINITY_DN258_c0_g2~~TRINITY_DN258_c0_g2_i1.p1  ORF type:complete len:505 (-),score=60.68 TRINITY_DN258_c0_g2_i1:1334-2848(-)